MAGELEAGVRIRANDGQQFFLGVVGGTAAWRRKPHVAGDLGVKERFGAQDLAFQRRPIHPQFESNLANHRIGIACRPCRLESVIRSLVPAQTNR